MRKTSVRALLTVMGVSGLLLGGCSTHSDSGPRTVTHTVTVAPSTPSSAQTPSTGRELQTVISVVAPDGKTLSNGEAMTAKTTPDVAVSTAGNTTSSSSTETAITTTSTATTMNAALKHSCPALLSPHDITRATGAKISADQLRIVDVANPDVGMIARIKCYYGTDDIKKATPLVVTLSQYETDNAAQRQMGVTIASEENLGAKESTVDVGDGEATVLIREGGFLIMRHGNWTAAIALSKKIVQAGPGAMLQKLANMVVARAAK